MGSTNEISCKLDEVKYFMWGMKNPYYIMKIMASGDGLVLDDTCKKLQEIEVMEVIKIKHNSFTKLYNEHCIYQHILEDKTNLHHAESTSLTP